jgi:hypothetical protein
MVVFKLIFLDACERKNQAMESVFTPVFQNFTIFHSTIFGVGYGNKNTA